MWKQQRTDFLFPNSSFIGGMGTVLNLRGKRCNFNYSATESEADYKAIRADWQIIGNDIMKALERVRKELIQR